jgi:hypothetical protein
MYFAVYFSSDQTYAAFRKTDKCVLNIDVDNNKISVLFGKKTFEGRILGTASK